MASSREMSTALRSCSSAGHALMMLALSMTLATDCVDELKLADIDDFSTLVEVTGLGSAFAVLTSGERTGTIDDMLQAKRNNSYSDKQTKNHRNVVN